MPAICPIELIDAQLPPYRYPSSTVGDGMSPEPVFESAGEDAEASKVGLGSFNYIVYRLKIPS